MSRWKHAWWIAGTALFLMVAAGLVVRLQVIRRDVERWENYQAECRSRGEDLGMEAWLPPTVPDGENFAAHPWIKAVIDSEKSPEAKVVEDWSFWRDDERIDGPGGPAPWFETNPEKAAMVIERGETLSADFKAIREAAGRPGCRLPVAGDRDPDRMNEILRRLRGMTEMVSLHAEAALAMDQEAMAVEDIETLLRMGDHLQSQRLLLPVVAGWQIKSGGVSLIEMGLAGEHFSSASRKHLRNCLKIHPTEDEIATIMRLERGKVLKEMGAALERRVPGELFGEGFMQPPARRAAQFKFVFCKSLDSILQKPQTRSTWEAYDQTVEEAMGDLPSAELAVGSLRLYSDIFSSSFQHADRVDEIRKQLAE